MGTWIIQKGISMTQSTPTDQFWWPCVHQWKWSKQKM